MAKIRQPLAPNYRRRRTTFDVDIEKLGEDVRNGMRIPVFLNQQAITETEYQRWLVRVGANGTSQGTRPEAAVYMELERLGYRAPESSPPGFDFLFQVPLGFNAFTRRAEAVADIYLNFTVPATVVRVNGEFFHFADAEQRGADYFERVILEGMGYRVVDILAQDTLHRGRLEEVVRAAILGYSFDTDGRLQVFK